MCKGGAFFYLAFLFAVFVGVAQEKLELNIGSETSWFRDSQIQFGN